MPERTASREASRPSLPDTPAIRAPGPVALYRVGIEPGLLGEDQQGCFNLFCTFCVGHHAALLSGGRRCVSIGAPVSSWKRARANMIVEWSRPNQSPSCPEDTDGFSNFTR